MRYEHTFRVQAPLASVVRFHAQATSLEAITPALIPIQVHHAPDKLDEGDEMDFTMWIGSLPVRWVARISDVSAAGFSDHQVRGPFESWTHRHSFIKVHNGTTEVLDEVEARLKRHPLWGPVGLAMWLGLPLLFAFRGSRTRRLLEGETR